MPVSSQGQMPKLQQVKYKTILPMNKTSQYTEGQKVEFEIPPEIAYFSGKQSYLNIEVRNDSKYMDEATRAFNQVCFHSHMGAHGLINRMKIDDLRGQNIEDLEAYNQYVGLLNSYCNDENTYDVISKVEGVSNRNSLPINHLCSDPKVGYFTDRPTLNADGEGVDNGDTNKKATFCLPINAGLYGAYDQNPTAVPNLDIQGHKLTLFLEKANVALRDMAGDFFRSQTINGATFRDHQGQSLLRPVAGVGSANTTFTIAAADAGCSNVWNNEPMCSAVGAANGAGDCSRIPYRVGMRVIFKGGAGGDQTVILTGVSAFIGAADSLTVTYGLDVAGAQVANDHTSMEVAPLTMSYIIEKIELKVLETVPDQSTMKMIRSNMMKGVNFQTYQLQKLSTAEGLKNAVLDIPSPITRGLSIFAVPVVMSNMNVIGRLNSYVYPRPDPMFDDTGANDNNTTYQYQVKNTLIPNVAVDTNHLIQTNNDNAILKNQQVMALRPVRKCLSLGNCLTGSNDEEPLAFRNPFFYPLLLSPVGTSYNLMDNDPQLRIENSSDTANRILSKLFFIYINHTRRMTANDGGVDISI